MAPTKPPVLPPAQPKHSAFFDNFSSSSTGHQRGENRGGSSTGWRLSRTAKLSSQFRSGGPLRQRESGSNAPAGSSILSHLSNPAASSASRGDDKSTQSTVSSSHPPVLKKDKGIFDNLVIYINGSTYPHISDHALKHLLASHGAKISIHLGRKQVTHVIVGTPSTSRAGTGKSIGGGAGGGLAGGKMQKEIVRVGGCGVRYVGVEWALESVKAGKRLPEAQFSNMKLSLSGQKSVRGEFFGVKASQDPPKSEEKAVPDG